MTHTDEEKLSYRIALEALRSGVPNGKAVEILGGNQPEAESSFQHLLDANQDARSMLISGDFGTGKSYVLECFKHHALSQNYVCSLFPVSKETPFYNLGKIFQSAVDNAVMPKIVDFADSDASGLHKIFPATLMIHKKSHDQELITDIVSFWSGNRITQKKVKDGLKTVGEQHNYQFSAPKARDLPVQRLRFVLELIKAAGYKGWVILIDELELIGSYGILQRAKSYAELARWMGLVANEEYPGMTVVGTITDDFESSIIYDKDDNHKAVPKLRERGDEQAATMAQAGIESIFERKKLEPISEQVMQTSIDKIREIYSIAYDWAASPFEDHSPRGGYQRRMRYRVRSAINSWDLQRLYPDSHPNMEATEYKRDYTEDQDLASEVSSDTDSHTV